MRLLLTGAAGFIGAHVAREALRRGDEVAALLRPATSRERLRDLAAQLDAYEGALDDPGCVARALERFRPDAVVHLAWYAQPDDYLGSPRNRESLEVTTGFAQTVFAHGDVHLVGVGSCAEYAEAQAPRREEDPTEPQTLYGRAKLEAWRRLEAFGQARSRRPAWARLFHVHGPGERPERVVPSAAAAFAESRTFALRSDGSPVRDHLHVSDVARALLTLAERRAAGVFNVCSGAPVTLREVVEAVGRAVGRPGLARYAPTQDADRPSFLVGDPARLRALGWHPLFADLDASLAYLAPGRG